MNDIAGANIGNDDGEREGERGRERQTYSEHTHKRVTGRNEIKKKRKLERRKEGMK